MNTYMKQLYEMNNSELKEYYLVYIKMGCSLTFDEWKLREKLYREPPTALSWMAHSR